MRSQKISLPNASPARYAVTDDMGVRWVGYFRRFKARRRLAIAFNGFSVAVRKVARTRSQISGLVGSRGISGGRVGCRGAVEVLV